MEKKIMPGYKSEFHIPYTSPNVGLHQVINPHTYQLFNCHTCVFLKLHLCLKHFTTLEQILKFKINKTIKNFFFGKLY